MIIALGHRSGHGKDTFAELLQSKLGSDKVYIRSWADAVKETALKLYGHLGLQDRAFYNTREGREVRNWPIPKIGKTPVEIWIHVGEKLRELYWDTWKDQLVNYYMTLPPNTIVVVPDTRHINEAETADILIKITNPRVPNRVGASIDDILADYDWPFEVINDGTLEEYAKKIDHIIEDYQLATYTDRSHLSLLSSQNPRRSRIEIQSQDGGSV